MNDTIDVLSGAGTVLLGDGTLTVGGNDGTGTFFGVIEGEEGSFGKTGSGTQTLSGDHEYTGATTVGSGTLTNNGRIGRPFDPTTALNVSTDATFNGSGTVICHACR